MPCAHELTIYRFSISFAPSNRDNLCGIKAKVQGSPFICDQTGRKNASISSFDSIRIDQRPEKQRDIGRDKDTKHQFCPQFGRTKTIIKEILPVSRRLCVGRSRSGEGNEARFAFGPGEDVVPYKLRHFGERSAGRAASSISCQRHTKREPNETRNASASAMRVAILGAAEFGGRGCACSAATA